MKEEKRKIYEELLRSIVEKNEMKPWLSAPSSCMDKNMASDIVRMLVTPKVFEDAPDCTYKVRHVWPKEHNQDLKINIADVQRSLDSADKIDCYDEVEAECGACHGSGEVDADFYYEGDHYDVSDVDCPVCDASGVTLTASTKPNGKKKFNPWHLFQIGESAFMMLQIQRLVDIAKVLGLDEIVLIHQTEPNSPSIFRLDECEYVLMPCRVEHPHKVTRCIPFIPSPTSAEQ